MLRRLNTEANRTEWRQAVEAGAALSDEQGQVEACYCAAHQKPPC